MNTLDDPSLSEKSVPLSTGMTIYYENVESREGRELCRLQPSSGQLEAGSMNQVLAPPGHGKTSFLRMLSNRQHLEGASRVYFNGQTQHEAERAGIDGKQLSSYQEQCDFNLSVLTVEETFQFARQSMPYHSMDEVHGDVERMLSMQNLTHCKDTAVGDSVRRGVSGGERRRTSIGEMLLGPAPLLLLDQFSDGLDSDAVGKILTELKRKCVKRNKTVVCVLQQCSPEMQQHFDTLILLNEGYTVYHGPTKDVEEYMKNMGFPCPADEELGDFLMDIQIQPEAVGLDGMKNAIPLNAKSMREYFSASTIGRLLETRICEYRTVGGSAYQPMYGVAVPAEPRILRNTLQQPSLLYGMNAHTVAALSKHQRSANLGIQLKRETLLLLRNRDLQILRQIKSIFIAALCGSLLYDTRDVDYHQKCTVFLVSLTLLSFSSLAELPVAVQGSKTAVKHIQAGLFSSSMFICASMQAILPLLFLDCVVFMSITYWMTNLAPHANEFLQVSGMLYIHSVVMTLWFRYLASVVNNESVAQAIAAPMTGVWLVFSGFFTSDFKPIVQWLFWVSPFSWSYRAQTNIEFHSQRYDSIVLDEHLQPIRLGKLYMHVLNIQYGTEWIGYAVIYAVGQCLVLYFQYCLTLDNRYYELIQGTRRQVDGNSRSNAENIHINNDAENIHISNDAENIHINNDENIHINNDENIHINNEEITKIKNDESLIPNVLHTLHTELPFEPVTITFRDVGYSVPLMSGGVKQILQGVTGFMAPGCITALMGASGSGKTTLLNLLSGRVTMGTREGEVKINKEGFTSKRIHHVSGYVEQFDSLFPSDTVEEALQFSCKTRQPKNTSASIITKVVVEVMQVLELSSVSSRSIHTLSPSQQKLTSIGIELVANPSIQFLDEITTGLNSVAAETVMRIVKKVATAGRTVIACVHQPSSKQFFYFDRLLLLAPGGSQVFFGQLGTRSHNLIEYLTSIPGTLPLLTHRNPSNWMLEEVARFKKLQERTGDNVLHQFYISSEIRKHKLKELACIENAQSTAPSPQKVKRPGIASQYVQLQKRSFQFYFRNIPQLLSRIIVLGVLGQLFGQVFYRVELDSQASAEAGIAVAFIPMIFGAFVHAASAQPLQFDTRVVFYREKSSAMYKPWLWPIVAFITEIKWTSITSQCMFLPYYYISNLHSTTEAFFKYWLASFCTCMCLTTVAFFVYSVSPNITIGGFLLSLVFAILMLLSGIFVAKPHIPDLWLPLYYALPFSHLAEAAVMSQFKYCTQSLATCPSILSVEGFDIIVVPAFEYIAHRMGFSYTHFYKNIGWATLYITVCFAITILLTSKVTFMSR